MNPWENEDGSTNVDGFLTAYMADDNTFWRVEIGHILNVVDELMERLGMFDPPPAPLETCRAKRWEATPSYDGDHVSHLFAYGPNGVYIGHCAGWPQIDPDIARRVREGE